MSNVSRLWRSLTEEDNETIDYTRVAGAIAVLAAAHAVVVFLVLSIVAFFVTTLHFDPVAFGNGACLLLGGLGTFLALMGVAKKFGGSTAPTVTAPAPVTPTLKLTKAADASGEEGVEYDDSSNRPPSMVKES